MFQDHKDDFPTLDPASVKKCIRNINSLDSETVTINQIIEQLKPLFEGYSIRTITLRENTSLWRASVNHKANHKSDLLYPPPEIASIGRVNREKQQVLYCTSDPKALFFEKRVQVGDKFSISNWVTINKCLVNNIGFTQASLKHLNSQRSSEFINHLSALDEGSRLVQEFLSEKFTDKVADETEKYKYKLTIAIKEYLTLPIQHEEIKEFNGLLYPSIEFGHADNLALTTDFADASLKFVKAEYVQIDVIKETQNGKQITYKILDMADSLTNDDVINWKSNGVFVEYNGKRWLVEDVAKFKVENNEWIAYDKFGNTIPPIT